MKTGNELWWSQVASMLTEMPQGTHYREAETEVFYRLVHRMESEGLSRQVIRDHFQLTFNIGQSAFYSRLRRVGMKYVI